MAKLMAWVNVQMESDLKRDLEKIAQEDDRTVSGTVRWLIKKEVDYRQNNLNEMVQEKMHE